MCKNRSRSILLSEESISGTEFNGDIARAESSSRFCMMVPWWMGNPNSRKSIVPFAKKPASYDPNIQGCLNANPATPEVGQTWTLDYQMQLLVLSRTSVPHLMGILGLDENFAAIKFKGIWWHAFAPFASNPLLSFCSYATSTSSTTSTAAVPEFTHTTFKQTSGAILTILWNCSGTALTGSMGSLPTATVICSAAFWEGIWVMTTHH